MNIPAPALQSITCEECRHYLAGTTYTYPETNISLCENCSSRTKGQKFREIAYEALANNYLFPCPNDNCCEKLIPKKLKKHLKYCPHKPQKCILDCGWRGTESTLIEHFTYAHKEKILWPNTWKEFSVSKQCFPRYLLNTEEQCFLIEVHVDSGFLSVTISFPYDSPKTHKYIAWIHSIDESGKKCVINCKEDKTEKLFCELKVGFYKNIHMKITINNAKITIPTPAPENEYLLNSLKCSKCKCFMYEKIYLCSNGHNVCDDCKKEPCYCYNSFTTRNHTLESLTDTCLYPCRYLTCHYFMKCNEKLAHENHCEFSRYPCPICFKVQITRTTIHDHFKSVHKFYIKQDREGVEFAFTEPSVIDCFYFLRESGYFRLTHKYLNKFFLFSVQYLGNPVLAERYVFRVCAENKVGDVFMAEHKCTAFTKFDDIFCEPKRILKIPYCTLKPYVNDKTIYYHVFIYKNV